MRTVALAALLLLALAACGPQQPTALYTGTEGLHIEFVESAPPLQVYEGRPLPIRMLVHNRGTSDVRYDRMRFGFSVDPLYISSKMVIAKPEDLHPTGTVLRGKSIDYPPGADQIYAVPPDQMFEVKRVLGLREEPTTRIAANVCYAYTTTMTETVCIDTSGAEQNMRAQPCAMINLADADGQGAPVAVTSVELESIPVYDRLSGQEAVQPHFFITIENVGGGRIVGPDTLEIENACLQRNIPASELGAVRIDARLLSTKLECVPSEIIPIIEGVGQARCSVPANQLANSAYLAKQNFVTALSINLSYIYLSSVQTEITIKRTSLENPDLPLLSEVPGYVYSNGQLQYNSKGDPLTKCEQYAAKDASVPEGWEVTADFSCACSASDCEITKNKRTCIPNACPGTTWCCAAIGKVQIEQTTPTT